MHLHSFCLGVLFNSSILRILHSDNFKTSLDGWIRSFDIYIYKGRFLSFYSRYAATVERHRGQESTVNPYRNDSIVGIMAYFFAYFRPNCHDILILKCCPRHLRGSVKKELKEESVVRMEDGSSMKPMRPKDEAYVLVSGGISPYTEGMNLCLM